MKEGPLLADREIFDYFLERAGRCSPLQTVKTCLKVVLEVILEVLEVVLEVVLEFLEVVLEILDVLEVDLLDLIFFLFFCCMLPGAGDFEL